MKKVLVLGILFILPIVAYLFFASGIHNFAKLPVITENVYELNFVDDVQLEGKITVLGFLGKDIEAYGGTLFNLDQKIYKYFYEFQDFQFVYLVPEDASKTELDSIVAELSQISDMSRWKFVFAKPQEIEKVFASLNSPYSLNSNLGSPYIFIIDKKRGLRGRDDDEDVEILYGYNSTDIAELANKMKDDVKIVLAEYRLALKKNNADRQK
tara:strand:- start:41 stop:673 length:633 start_codon:yes stop_codon:yes gene_type:complete